jgi:hypothetical protein
LGRLHPCLKILDKCGSYRQSSFLSLGINDKEKTLEPMLRGSTWVGSILAFKNLVRVEVTDKDKRSSLLGHGINDKLKS